MTSRELVLSTLEFRHRGRMPRQCWCLPWAEANYPDELVKLRNDFPGDIVGAPGFLKEPLPTVGNAYRQGIYTDEWGCSFVNLQDGIIGEVKEPIVTDWNDLRRVIFPTGALSIDRERIDAFCGDTDKFVLAGCCPRPFERLQFIRGTENLMIDLALEEPGLLDFIRRLHEFYLRELERWCATAVDGVMFMDDWGSQKSLLIDPVQWRRIFKPLYRDYVALAHAAGKKVFMHSDGYILAIYPDLIEIGVDAVNSQLFCMGIEQLAPYAGKITFWGEIDRQHLLVNGTYEEIERAVDQVYAQLYADGGIIAQCEFGPGATPDRVRAVFAAWDRCRTQ